MEDRNARIEQITRLVVDVLEEISQGTQRVPVGISARHLHLSKEHVEALFGPGHQLTPMKALSQPGQYACEETVDVVGPKGTLHMRVLGPVRAQSQVEIAFSESRKLGIVPPVKNSGDLAGTPGIVLKGPKGQVELKEGLIVADRHVHMSVEDGVRYGIADGDKLELVIEGGKPGIIQNVTARVGAKYALDCHLDIDDANAFQLKQGQWVVVRKQQS